MFSMSGTILAQKNVSEIVLEFKDAVYTIEEAPPPHHHLWHVYLLIALT